MNATPPNDPDPPKLPNPTLLPEIESEWEAVLAAMDADDADKERYQREAEV